MSSEPVYWVVLSGEEIVFVLVERFVLSVESWSSLQVE